METKKIEKTWVAAHSLKTTLSKLQDIVGVKPDMVKEELNKQGIESSAPQIWNYIDCDGKMDTEFTLEICFPVEKQGTDNDIIEFKELKDFKCITHTHNGPWTEFGQVYEKIFEGIGKEGIMPTGNSREVYHNCDFEDQTKCITEIQIEVQ